MELKKRMECSSTGFSDFHKINTKLSKQFIHKMYTFSIHFLLLLLLLRSFVLTIPTFLNYLPFFLWTHFLFIFINKNFNFFFIVGRPAPKVTWWRDNVELISSTSHPSADEGASAVVNQLFIGTVTRDFYGTRLECRAQGSKLLPPVVKEITVQVHCEYIL